MDSRIKCWILVSDVSVLSSELAEKTRKMTDSASSCGLMALNCNKAGMAGLDKEKINQIIEEASKGSKFYKKKQDDQVRIDRQVTELQLSLSRLHSDQIEKARKEADG